MKCPECDHDLISGKCMYCGFVSESDQEKNESVNKEYEALIQPNNETEVKLDKDISDHEQLAYQLKDLPESMRIKISQAIGKEDTFISDDDLVQLKIKEAFIKRDTQSNDDIFSAILAPSRKPRKGKMSLMKQLLIVILSAMAVVLMFQYLI